MGTRPIAALALAAAALAASGCGSASTTTTTTTDHSESTSSTSTAGSDTASQQLSRAELTTKANAVCVRLKAQLAPLAVRNPGDAARIYSQSATIREAAREELSKLDPPSELSADWKQILTAAETFAKRSAKVGEYIAAKNEAGISALTKEQGTSTRQIAVLAKRDGLVACAEVL